MNKTFPGILLTLLLILLLSGEAHAVEAPPPSIGVSPARVEIDIGHRTTTGSATVLNLSDRPITVTSSVVNFDLDENNNFRELPPEPGLLSTAIMINPVQFTIQPNGSQTVRFAISPERLGQTGEHRAMLFFSELVDTTNASLKINFRLGIPIYARFGETTSIAHVHNVAYEQENSRIALDISSNGTEQVQTSGYFVWWPADDFNEKRAMQRVEALARNPQLKPPDDLTGGRLAAKPVFPGTRRAVYANLVPPADDGEYVLVYSLDAGGEQIQRAIPSEWPPVLIVDSD